MDLNHRPIPSVGSALKQIPSYPAKLKPSNSSLFNFNISLLAKVISKKLFVPCNDNNN